MSRAGLRVLLLSRYAALGASSRLRSMQYIAALSGDGFEIRVSALFDDDYLRRLYGGSRRSPMQVAGAYLRRGAMLLRARQYDLLWIEKELFPYLPATVERLLRRLGVAMLVDYDDAIFHHYDRANSTLVRRLLGRKIDVVMRSARLVVVGNHYLGAHARVAGAGAVERIPTVVDLARYPTIQRQVSSPPFRLGWIGSPGTQRYLQPMRGLWRELHETHGAPLRAIGATASFAEAIGVEAEPWSEDGEVARLDSLDAGVMPLPDAPWERGKCAYKLIQYMACWKPVIASPVGANLELVEHGVNGLLASTPAEWRQAIDRLASDPELRLRMGRAGRHRVEQRYSLDAMRPRLSLCLRQAAGRERRPAGPGPRTVVLFANTAWYLYNFRRSLAFALRDAGFDVLLLSPDDGYGGRLSALGLHWQPVSLRRAGLNPFREFAFVVGLIRLFRRIRPVLVHGFTIKCALYGSLAARLAGVPAQIAAIAGLGYVFASDAPRARLLRPAVRRLMRTLLNGRDSRLILQNPDDVAMFERAGLVDGEHIRMIPGSGVDTMRFRPKPGDRNRGSGQPTTVLLAARLLWDKGLAEYVDAARRLGGSGGFRFLLAGTPDPDNPGSVAETTVRAWVDEGLVEWLGHVEDMASLLVDVDVFVLPTCYREGLPKSLLEAAACGLPLVASDAPGCREVVRHERTGLLVPVRDGAALAVAIRRLREDPALALRLGDAARTLVLAEYDERIVIERTVAVYRELLPAPLMSAA